MPRGKLRQAVRSILTFFSRIFLHFDSELSAIVCCSVDFRGGFLE